MRFADRVGLVNIHQLALKTSPEIRVGIGFREDDPREQEVVRRASFCGLDVFRDEASLLDAQEEGRISGAVRGSLSSSPFLQELKRRYPEEVCRIALLTLADGRSFLLGPVGVDEGGTIQANERLARDMRDFCGLLDWEPRIAVLSGGRMEDAARARVIAESIERGEAAALLPDVRHFNIMIEEAMKWADCVIAPDGVSGNLIYRTLAHFGQATSLGALYFPLPLRLADTSRNGAVEEYLGAIALANIAAGRRLRLDMGL
jgi:predicted methyltransferase MtxX (methanogen marker protein 4)